MDLDREHFAGIQELHEVREAVEPARKLAHEGLRRLLDELPDGLPFQASVGRPCCSRPLLLRPPPSPATSRSKPLQASSRPRAGTERSVQRKVGRAEDGSFLDYEPELWCELPVRINW